MILSHQISLFLQSCTAKGLSEHSLRAYEQDLRALTKWAPPIDATELLTKPVLTDWINHMRQMGYSPATIKRRLTCCKIFCKWLEEEELITHNPFHRWKATIQLPKKLPRHLTNKEISGLLKDTPPAPRSMKTDMSNRTLNLALELLFATGIRVGELCAITMNDLDLDGHTIRIKGKGNRERKVFLVDATVRTLCQDYITIRASQSPITDHLLINSRGNSITPDYIRKALHQRSSDLSIPRKITPHMFRHTTATQLLENGVDIRFVQKLLGHASISTTEIYTHVSDTKLHQALQAANPRGRLISSDN